MVISIFVYDSDILGSFVCFLRGAESHFIHFILLLKLYTHGVVRIIPPLPKNRKGEGRMVLGSLS